ncbi:MAG: hypothetical protein ACLFSY_09960 [Desulfonatronovibrionaceae bacterium]
MLGFDSHLALVFSYHGRENLLIHSISQSQGHTGIISDRLAPFVSNINLAENITLPLLYHKNVSLTAALKKMELWFKALELSDVLTAPKYQLSRKQLLAGYLLRSAASGNRAVYVDWPRMWEVDFFLDCLHKIDSRIQLWVPVEEESIREFERRGFEVRDINRD